MAQLMPLPLTVSCFSKIQIGLPFWYRVFVALDVVQLTTRLSYRWGQRQYVFGLSVR